MREIQPTLLEFLETESIKIVSHVTQKR